ncbi:P-loop containing nucleoside triphosphate hydrolase protein [Astrocystis sublimbata]|nr:P-loop containing nucleoside triphosphate hydrolase protein [Astrocystis sublimbata]
MFKALQHSNPIEARIALGDLPEASKIEASTKHDQFKKIMDALPGAVNKKIARADKTILEKATRSFGFGKCLAKDGDWLVDGMKTPLHAHQLIGASWMLGREFCKNGPKGGILADEMGMGKTLETLACIVSNRPTDEDVKRFGKTTLIVAPAAAIFQWEEEIKKHVKRKYIEEVLHYKQSSRTPISVLKHMDIILASYQEISRNFPSDKSRRQPDRPYHSAKEFQKTYDDKLGVLFKMPFWRVVLDEGHNIKNRACQTSIGCQNLNGRYRWALSGTPITNSIDGEDSLRTYLTLSLRLRQGAAHPFNLERAMRKNLSTEDLLEIQRRLRNVVVERPFFERIGKWCAKKATVKLESDEEGRKTSFGISQFGHEFNIDRQLSLMLDSQKEDVCRICYQEAVEPQTAQCKHIFCKECIGKHLREEYKERAIPKCPDCDKSLTGYLPAEPSDSDDSDAEHSTSGAPIQPCQSRVVRLGLDHFGRHPQLKRSQTKFFQQSDQYYPEPVVPSAKTTAVKEAILEWQSQAPDDKIIVFIDFKVTSAVLGRMLRAENIPFLYFDGSMSSEEKEIAVRAFDRIADIKVMIMSLKSGAVALNLTMANRVIIVDPWWNVSVELQAFARVFRIGQKKETHFMRIIAENTIDNRIEALQEEKTEKISKIMEPGAERKLSVEEIVSLFGNVKKFSDGTFEVLRNDEEEEEDASSEEPQAKAGEI